jgi:hypothetical protein
MSTRFELLKIFQENLIKFIDEIIELLPPTSKGDIIMLRILFIDSFPMEDAMKIFSERILPHTKMVLERDENFFLNCEDLFAGIKKDKVSYFKDLWLSKELDDENKEIIWDWFTYFLKLAQKYNSLRM